MPISADHLRDAITKALPDATVAITDMQGDSDHYAVAVTSGAFRGLSRLKQHQLVYKALGDILKSQLHAMALTTRIPE
ncbi:MAG: BolA family transcriptional regulator [Alphaproteobacteria bacterium GM202ARS2]|nr:BolA family transcriptional regulator [Alphaproteobacteria bacterium GM202ARS2]